MTEPKYQGKSHDIPKRLVWDAWLKVKKNGGAAGVDGVTIDQFEESLKGNLFKLWNRMSSGSYFPGPVRAVEIPKKGGTRVLGIPNVVDRVAQTVAVLVLEPAVEKVFHEDSYGYVCPEQGRELDVGQSFVTWCCADDGGRPSGASLRGAVPNHPLLR
ncbi:MAG: hypothetical protein ACRDQY_00770 [Pseudonocardiaceae bacterium]